jgi:hypothetical protein
MFQDALLQVCDAQAFTAAAVSGRSIDLGNVTPKRVIGTGEPVGFAVTVDVLASCTTVKIEVIQATDEALSAGIVVLAERTFLEADLPAGAAVFMDIPVQAPAAGALRFIGIRATPSGGAATVTLSASLMPRSMFSIAPKSYAKGYTIS